MSEKNKFIEHYKANADDYDITRDFRNKITKYFHDKQVAYILETLKNINSVVEIGPGTGKFTIPLAKAGKYVIAIDSSEEMLDLIYKKAVEKAGTTNVDAVRKATYGTGFNAPGGFKKIDERNHHLHKPVLIGEIKKNGQFRVVNATKGLVRPQPWSKYTSPDKGCDWVDHKGTYKK